MLHLNHSQNVPGFSENKQQIEPNHLFPEIRWRTPRFQGDMASRRLVTSPLNYK